MGILMNKGDILSTEILQNNLTKIKELIRNDKSLLELKNSSGDLPLHSAVRYSQVAYDEQDFEKAKMYQKIADFLVRKGAKLSISNQFNDIVQINPDYNSDSDSINEISVTESEQLTNENVTVNHNNINTDSDSDFDNQFSDTVMESNNRKEDGSIGGKVKSFLQNFSFTGGSVEKESNYDSDKPNTDPFQGNDNPHTTQTAENSLVSISDNDSDYEKDNMLHSIESHNEISNQASDDVSLSELMFENVSDTENSLSIDNDDEELTFEDLSIMDNDITDIDMEGGYSRRR